jgi:hypothetical protein
MTETSNTPHPQAGSGTEQGRAAPDPVVSEQQLRQIISQTAVAAAEALSESLSKSLAVELGKILTASRVDVPANPGAAPIQNPAFPIDQRFEEVLRELSRIGERMSQMEIRDKVRSSEVVHEDVLRKLSQIGERMSQMEIRDKARSSEVVHEYSPYSSTQRIGLWSSSSPRRSAKPRGIF